MTSRMHFTVVQINTQNVSKPAIIIDAGCYGMELISPAAVMYFTEVLCVYLYQIHNYTYLQGVPEVSFNFVFCNFFRQYMSMLKCMGPGDVL